MNGVYINGKYFVNEYYTVEKGENEFQFSISQSSDQIEVYCVDIYGNTSVTYLRLSWK